MFQIYGNLMAFLVDISLEQASHIQSGLASVEYSTRLNRYRFSYLQTLLKFIMYSILNWASFCATIQVNGKVQWKNHAKWWAFNETNLDWLSLNLWRNTHSTDSIPCGSFENGQFVAYFIGKHWFSDIESD